MRLKELRLNKGLLQKDVAEYLGVDRTTYVKYENGISEPNKETLLKLSSFFDVSTDYLLGNERKKPASIEESELDEQERQLARLIQRLTADQKDFLFAQLKTLLEREQ